MTAFYKLDHNRNVVPCTRDDPGREVWIVADEDVGPFYITTMFTTMDLDAEQDCARPFETRVYFDYALNDGECWNADVFTTDRQHSETWDDAYAAHVEVRRSVMAHLEEYLGIPYTPYQHDERVPGPVKLSPSALTVLERLTYGPRQSTTGPHDQPDR